MSAEPFQIILLVHFFCCVFMTGLIWLIQLVHYPSFKIVDEIRFKEFHMFHSNKITYIVLPIMALELATAFTLCWSGVSVHKINFLLVLILWGLTGLVSVPLHNSLAKKHDLEKINQLVNTNWYRTAVWTLRSVIYSVMLSGISIL